MAGVSGWYSTAYICAVDPSKSHGVGWYLNGQLVSSTYLNPSTGNPYTLAELQGGGGTTAAGTASVAATYTPEQIATHHAETTGTIPTTLSASQLEAIANETAQIYLEGNALGATPANFASMTQSEQEAYIKETFGADVSGKQWGYGGGGQTGGQAAGQISTELTTPATAALPSLGDINVPAPAVTPAPAYEISPEQQAWQNTISQQLGEWVGAGGYGIPEETQALMIQSETNALKAKETEDIRVMRNNMERRGITNSGFVFSNEQAIRSNTTMAIAKSITDVQIQSALMKMASFETAMGAASQFLGYLGEMSQLKNQPAYQTWAAQQQATLYQYQAKMDLYKTQIQQAYTQQNMVLAGQIAATAAATQQEYNITLSQMEIEAANQQAAAEGAGNLLGTTIGGIFGML